MKFILTILMLFCLTTLAFSNDWWPPWKGLIEAKVAAVQAEFKDKVTGIRGDVTGIKGDVSGIKSVLMKFATEIDSQASAIAGVQNSVTKINSTIKTGRDNVQNSHNTTSTTNDSDLMKYIFEVLSGIFLAIITALGTIVKMQGKLINKLTEDNSKLLSEKEGNYEELVNFQSKMLENLLKSKETYKQKFFESLKSKEI